ncbi:MAG: DNA polymerase domain-containing protein [Verrucomicrobiota bacterium JB022]|nr:DNA polymerase domain-containing protein [Verrucomicrobiota bacterium JB022]
MTARADQEKTLHLVGLWVDNDGTVHLAQRAPGGEVETRREPFQPFMWTVEPPVGGECEIEQLAGPGPVSYLVTAKTPEAFKELGQQRDRRDELIRPFEHQWLLSRQERLFAGLKFGDLRRCQLSIKTVCEDPDGTSDPSRKEDRVLAIGAWFSGDPEATVLLLEEDTDAAERALLKQFNELLQERDPDILEGHNIFNFELDYLNQRSRRYRLPRTWGRFGGEPRFRKSRQRVAERWLDFLRCDIPGRAVFDSYLAVQLFDITAREMPGYGLLESAVHFGLTGEDDDRPDFAHGATREALAEDRPRFLQALREDLREIRGLADRLLPTYVAQAQNFPLLLQEASLRGTGQKVEMLLLEKYYEKRASLPDFNEVSAYEGGYTKSFGEGVYRRVLHFDVASLYPSLLLAARLNPASDHLGVFIPLLDELRTYRLRYKQLAREAADVEMRQEYAARQASFKILINSFYGYLGFGGARFADGTLAAEVTRQGRELLQQLIEAFGQAGAEVLEADTDGIYVAANEAHWEKPETLLAVVERVLPEGIHLEYDGSYPAMFCYKAKNYALFDGEQITIRGSALRSRGIEPFLKGLTDHLIAWLLGLEEEDPETKTERLAWQIQESELPVREVAKGEHLSMSPLAYQRKIEAGGKPRRAALEVALRMNPAPRMGEKVYYYIKPKEKGQTADWQRAEAAAHYDPTELPYDPKYYLKKLADWKKRYQVYWKK